MAIKQVSKSVHYLRARRNHAPFDLQGIIAKAREEKKTVADSEIRLGSGDFLRIQHYKSSPTHILLHLARYVPGVAAATLHPKARKAEDDEGAQTAPTGTEFKDGDCFLLVNGAHVLYCGHGISYQKTVLYLLKLFREASLNKRASGFDLLPSTKLDKLKLIQEHGVRAIGLRTTAFKMSLPKPMRRTWIAKALGRISDELSAVLEKDQSKAEQKTLEDLIVNVELRLDGNTRAAQDTQDFIEDLAQDVLDDKEAPISQFVIVTQKDGETVTAKDIRLQTTVKVDSKDNSVSHTSVWRKLGAYLDELAAANLLEQ